MADPWAPATAARPASATRWLMPLLVGSVIAALLTVLLYRPAGSGALDSVTALCTASAEATRAAGELQQGDGGAAERLRRAASAIDLQLDTVQRAMRDADLRPPALDEFARAWQHARARLTSDGDAAAALAAMHGVTERSLGLALAARELSERQRAQLEMGLKGLMAALAALLLFPLHGLWRQRQRMRHSLRQFSDELGADSWRDAVSRLRDERLGPPSAFDALASGVETVLGESDRRWQALADLSADWYWETDVQHRLCWLSASAPAAADGLGQRHDQIGLFRAPAGGWDELHQRMARQEAFRDVEFALATPGVWVSISGRPRHDGAGRWLGCEGVGRDISQRKAELGRLQASEQRWSTMTRLAADWYWQTDAEHRLLAMPHEQVRRIGDALAERLEGRTRWEAHREALTPQQWAEHRADLDARRPFRSLQLEVDDGHGRLAWISLTGVPRLDSAGRFVGYHGVGRDITARKQAEALLLRHNEALQRAVDERTQALQQLNLDLDAFSRQLAHELRTPIGQVQGLAQMLADRAGARLTPAEHALLDLQVKAAQGMRGTLEALLELARSGLRPMPQDDLDLTALAHEVLADLPKLPRRGALHWQVQRGMRVHGNADALKIVLANLLGNAAKFTRDTELPVVRLTCQPSDAQRVCLKVEDNGAGFDAQRAHLLFRPFSRLHSRDLYPGSGIGLNIVQRIVERHGGTVRASGELQRGAVFEITLSGPVQPLATAQAAVENLIA